MILRQVRHPKAYAWNDKNLDYEIETGTWCFPQRAALAWNDKNLDYEIETPWLSFNFEMA